MMTDDGEQLGLAAEVTAAWLANPHTRAGAEDVAALLGAVLAALRGLGEPMPEPTQLAPSAGEHTPVVTKRKSLASPDHIISMIDGTKHRSLTRHLRKHGLTPEEYRARYKLKPDYPMVAPGYSAERSASAKQHNFGRPAAAQSAPTVDTAPRSADSPKRRRLGIAGAKQAAQAHLGTGEGGTGSAPGSA